MSGEGTYSLTVNLVNGETLRLRKALNEREERNIGSNIESALESNYLGFELDGKLVIIPAHNIATIEIDPAPEILIKSVVRGAERQ